MRIDNSKENVSKNIIWKLLERVGAQSVSFAVSIVLARILSPDDYGIVAIVLIFTRIASIFVTFGLGTALIQKKDADDVDFSTIFYINVLLGIFLYALLFVFSPVLAAFYKQSKLTNIIRVLALQIPFLAINSVQQSYVSKKMQFKKFFWATLGGTVLSAVVGIKMAVMGMGAWALVAQIMTNTIVDTVVLGIVIKWKPKLFFSIRRAKPLVKYGINILGMQLLNSVYDELRGLIIGKKYTNEELAFFNRGQQFPIIIITNFDISISSVLFASMSYEQEQPEKVLTMLRRTIKTTTFFTFPMMAGMFLVAKPMTSVLLTDKWLGCVSFIQISCLAYMLYGVVSVIFQAVKALGESRRLFVVQIVHKVIMVPIIIVATRIGVIAIAMTEIISYMFQLFLTMPLCRRIVGYKYIYLLKDCENNILNTFIMGLGVYIVGRVHVGSGVKLALQIAAGLIIYIVFALVSRNSTLKFLYQMIMRKKENASSNQ